ALLPGTAPLPCPGPERTWKPRSGETPSVRGPIPGAAATCDRNPHDRAPNAGPALRPLGPERLGGAHHFPGPDRRADRDLLRHAHPTPAQAAGAPPSAAGLAAARRQDRDLGRHHRRGRAPEGRRGDREERRVARRRDAHQHREHPQPVDRSQAPVTVRKLHLLGSPVLRQRAAPVASVDAAVRELVDDLLDTMRAAKGVGLAANQVGIARRVAVVDVGEDDPPPLVLVNPRIVTASDEHETAEEGCLSIPEIYGDVERALRVTLEALDKDGHPYRTELSGFKARAVQHEIDHLDGVLFLDHLSAVKRGLLLAKWKKARKGQSGYVKEVTPEPAG